MQVPRGTFRDLKRELGLHSLISNMAEVSFSGYCKIISRETSILLVFRNGTIILAEYGELKGAAAMEQISRAGDFNVDVILHDLNDTQLQLALEFNPSCVLPRGVQTMERVDNPTPMSSEEAIPLQFKELGKAGVILSDEEDRSQPGVPDGTPLVSVNPPRPVPNTADDEASMLIRELDALDVLEIESMAEKFRASCRQMIEKLDLDGLLEQNLGDENHDPN
jgi:hypothetical protein